jgi:Putative Actinobacterial Holin-X, holin superfamily III
MIDQTVEDRARVSEPSLSSLVGGIINDFQALVKQEVALARREFAEELRKARQAAISLGIGVGVLVVGSLLLIFMLVFLLSWAVPAIPLWGSFGIIGGLLIVTGAALLLRAKSKAEDIHVVPERTAETMKENLKWIKNPTS